MQVYSDPSRYDSMDYRRCGQSGLLLPALSLGLWHNFGSTDSFDNAQSIVHKAFDLGITHFDLANNYGPPPGSAECTFGRILKGSLVSHRDEIIVSTKAGHRMWPGPYGDGSSRKNLMASLHQSLRRLQIDYVDIFYSHRYDAQTPLEETLQTLVDIVRSGKALYIGLSKYPPKQLDFACRFLSERAVPCLIHQDRYSLLSRKPEEGVLSTVQQHGLGFIAFSPLAQGLLTDKYLNGIPDSSRAAQSSVFLKREDITPELQQRLRALNQLAQQRGNTLSQMALRWLLDQSVVTSVLVGASSPEQLVCNADVLHTAPLSDEEKQSIERILNDSL